MEGLNVGIGRVLLSRVHIAEALSLTMELCTGTVRVLVLVARSEATVVVVKIQLSGSRVLYVP
jgi:hypothetical protein